MSPTDPRHAELEQLLVALEVGELDDTGQVRLRELLADPQLLDVAVEHLETEALLRWHHGAVPDTVTAPPARRPARRLRLVPVLLSAAAAALLLAPLAYWYATRDPGTGKGSEDTTPRVVALTSGWQLQPAAGAEFEVTRPDKVVLTRGELLVRSVRTPAAPFAIQTPFGEARASGTEFLVGTHTRETSPIMNTPSRLTRVLVLSGTVTLTNLLGAATARAGDFLVAPQGGAPTNVVAQSGSDFGFDLYRELARSNLNQNMFFSPYSITNVLTMAAEGARGGTAEEMGTVLRWPASARRIGDDTQRIPFRLARIRTGYEELNRLFNAGQSPAQRQLVKRVEQLGRELAELVPQREDLADQSKWDAVRKLDADIKAKTGQYDRLAAQVKSYRLSVANALWGDKSYPFARSYVDTMAAAYGSGSVVAADFVNDPAGEVRRINEWVASQTGNRIPKIVGPRSVNSLTRLVLLNAIHFKGEWVSPFEISRTRPGPFTNADGNEVQIPMMVGVELKTCRYGAFNADGSFFPSPKMRTLGKREGLYPDAGGCLAVELPYRGEDLAMVILLPTSADGLTALEGKLSAARLQDWMAKLEPRPTTVRMPKFEAETSYDLKDALRALGMERAFRRERGPSGADFSGMTDSTNPQHELFVQSVLHRASITVDEKGTEAAAATAFGMVGKGAPTEVPFVPFVHARHPFVYLIRDVRTGVVLFLGRVAKL